MKFLFTVLFGLYAYTDAQPGNVGSINLGPIHTHAQVGNLSEPYDPLTLRDLVAQNNAIHFIEWTRTIFEHGFGPVPPLDPFRASEISNLDLNLLNGVISADVELSNLELRGSKDFSLDNVTVRVDTARVDYTFHVAEYDAEVDYNAHITIDDAKYDFTGHMRLTAVGVTIKGASQAVIDKDVFQLAGIELDIQADNVKVNLQNSRRSARNPIGAENIIDVVGEIANAVADVIVQTALLQTNDILVNFNVAQVMAILLPNN